MGPQRSPVGRGIRDELVIDGDDEGAVVDDGRGSANRSRHAGTPCDPLPVCSVKGIYSGTYTNQNNFTGTFAYKLEDNNFSESGATANATPTAFGGYWNSCDSIRLNSFNSINDNYYYFEGKFSNGRTAIEFRGAWPEGNMDDGASTDGRSKSMVCDSLALGGECDMSVGNAEMLPAPRSTAPSSRQKFCVVSK